MREQTIHLHRQAPVKPLEGQPCNGCGVCCAAAPCPLGMLLTASRQGRCQLLRWDDVAGSYGCGALLSAPRPARPLVRRWIGAGAGCDSDLQAEAVED